MKNFLESSGFVLTFLVACLGWEMLFGPKVLEAFLWLVLAGMVLINVDKVTQAIGKGVQN